MSASLERGVAMTTRGQISEIPAGRWRLDPAHSYVGFRVVDAEGTVATVHGRFRQFEGMLDASAYGEHQASGTVTVDSLTTDESDRDQHLLSADFLDARRFPKIEFSSRDVRLGGDGTLQIDGKLSLQEREQDVVLAGRLRRVGEDGSSKKRLALELANDFAWGETVVLIEADLSLVEDGQESGS